MLSVYLDFLLAVTAMGVPRNGSLRVREQGLGLALRDSEALGLWGGRKRWKQD